MTDILEKVMLVKVSSTANNNKFYEVKLMKDGTVLKRWGRVGTDGQSSNENSGKRGFDRLVKAKMSKGYKEVKVVGSSTQKDSHVDKEEVRRASRQGLATDPNDKAVVELIDRLVEKNKHEILEASGGLIQVSNSGVIETALGIIEPGSLKQAESILTKLENSKNITANYKSLLEEYLTLVPQKVPHARGWEKDFFKENPIAKQRSLLQQLEQSYEWYQNEQKALEDSKDKDEDEKEVDYSDYFRYKLSSLPEGREGKKIFDHVNKLFTDRKRRNNLTTKHKLVNVYVIEDNQGDEVFNDLAKKLGNVQELWHGSQSMNLLSILRKSLFCPPINRSNSNYTISGRMLGNGLYFSKNSLKSINYSLGGVWSGSRQTDCFMLLNDVICGKEYHPKHYSEYAKAYAKHNSIIAEPGALNSARNHEAVVWEPNQAKPRYLCEFAD